MRPDTFISIRRDRLVAARAGFEDYCPLRLQRIPTQASEQYKQGIFHRSPTSHAESPKDSIFSANARGIRPEEPGGQPCQPRRCRLFLFQKTGE